MPDQVSSIQPYAGPVLDETDSPESRRPLAILPASMFSAPLFQYVFAKLQEMFGLWFGRSMPNGDRENMQILHGPNRFDSLPPELLIEIFERVDLDDLISLQLVSRKTHHITHTALHGQWEAELQLTQTAYEYFAKSHTPAKTALPELLGGELRMVGEYGLQHAIAHSRNIGLPLGPFTPVNADPLPAAKLASVLDMLEEHVDQFQFLELQICNMPKSAVQILAALPVGDTEKKARPVSINIDLSINEHLRGFEAMQAEAQAHVGEILARLKVLLQSGIEINVLDLNNLSIGEGISTLGPALEENDKVLELSLNDNNIGLEGAQRLARMMEKHHALEMLSLSGNGIGTAGAKYLANALKSDSVLTKLYVGHNEISDDGMAAIAAALLDNPSSRLKILEMNGNHIGNLGMTSFALLLERSDVLTSLALGSTVPDPALATDSVGMLLNALKNNATLNYLVLAGLFNGNAAAGQWMAGELALMLAENKTLEILVAAYNSMGEAALIQLINAIPDDTGLISLNLSGNLEEDQEPGPDLLDAIADKKADITNARLEEARIQDPNIEEEDIPGLQINI